VPGSAAAWNDLGVTWLALEEPAAARTCFEQALASDPDFAPARANLQQT
jgi:Tfp pilus assembly protein PilF